MKTPGWLYLLATLLPATLAAIAVFQDLVPADALFRDPLIVAHEAAASGDCCHIYFGVLSNMGVLLWCAGASVCLFASIVLISRRASLVQVYFMLFAGLLTAILMFDDLFQAHEFVYPALFGINEKSVFAVYVLLILGYLALFGVQIFQSDFAMILISLAAFAMSVLADTLMPPGGPAYRLLDDGAKLVGIASWTAFHSRAGWRLCR